MTIEQLLGKTPEELEAMTDEQLKTYFEPYLKATRPDLQPPRKESNKMRVGDFRERKPLNQSQKAKLAQAKALAAQLGLKLNL